MTQYDFDGAVTIDISAIVQHCIDRDYGPYIGHPMDPRTPHDDTPLHELPADVRRARVSEMSRDELETELLDAIKGANYWRQQYEGLERRMPK